MTGAAGKGRSSGTSTSEFARIAKTLGLSAEATAEAWGRLPALGMGPDDPEVVRLLLIVAGDEQARRVSRGTADALGGARAVIVDASREVARDAVDFISTVRRVTAEQAEAVSVDIAQRMTKQIADSVNDAVVRAAEQRGRSSRNTWAAATFAIASGCSLIAADGAWYAGRSTVQSDVALVEKMLQREDGAAWASIMTINDMTQILAVYCGPGSPNVHRLEGGLGCTMPLWIHHDGVIGPAPGRAAEMAAGIAEVRDALQTGLGTWGLLMIGAAAMLGFFALARIRIIRHLFSVKVHGNFED